MSTATQLTLPSTSLYFKEGVSNKEYHAQVVGNEADGFRVTFQYGRVGSKLTAGSKTKAPVDFATAKQVYDNLVQEKQSKGYTTGASGTPYQDTENAGRVAGVLPQLLNFIQEEEVQQYIDDPAWVMQEKMDGVRCMIKKTKGIVEGVNRKGLITHLPLMVEASVRDALGEADAVLDGELVGDTYHIFDALVIGVHALAQKPYDQRIEAMREWLEDGLNEQHFRIVATAVGKCSKKSLYNSLKKHNAEGVVFKNSSSPYKAGRPNSGGNQVKFKFTAEATVRVRCLNTTKASFQMEVLSKGDWKYIGDCTYYPTKYTPKPGDFVEVRYLYAYPSGSLFQPFLKEQRTDVDEDACLMSQLKYKQGTEEDEE